MEIMTYTDWQCEYTRKAKLKHKIRKQKAKQKFIGFCLIVFAIIVPIILEGDATASLFCFPLGIYMVLTRENHFRERKGE